MALIKDRPNEITASNIDLDADRLVIHDASADEDKYMKPSAIVSKRNLTAIVAPGVSNDSSQGYSVGSIWIDVTNDVAYICVDVTIGAAVWLQTSTIANTDNLESFFNGTFLEKFHADVTESGGTVTLNLEQSGGGDLLMRFSSGNNVFDCTPKATATLTIGSDISPQVNFIYILESDQANMTVSTSGWPAGVEHIKVAFCFVPSAAFVTRGTTMSGPAWT